MKTELKTFLLQAFKLKEEVPYSKVKYFIERYQNSDNIFLDARRGKKVKVLNEEFLFEFIRQESGFDIYSFEDIENILNASTREENIKYTKDSKNTSISPFHKTMLIKQNNKICLYQDTSLNIKKLVAIENAETFLNIQGDETFLYLSGNPNKLIREFIKDKEVKFFIDLDIISLNMYENIECKSKTLFVPSDFDELLEKYGNQDLYLKQRRFLKDKYTLTQKLIDKIARCNKVLEQEVIKYDSY